MWNVKTKVVPVIIGATGTISKIYSENMWATYRESTKSRNYRKRPCGTLPPDFAPVHNYCVYNDRNKCWSGYELRNKLRLRPHDSGLAIEFEIFQHSNLCHGTAGCLCDGDLQCSLDIPIDLSKSTLDDSHACAEAWLQFCNWMGKGR
jgi:hypothetical protein